MRTSHAFGLCTRVVSIGTWGRRFAVCFFASGFFCPTSPVLSSVVAPQTRPERLSCPPRSLHLGSILFFDFIFKRSSAALQAFPDAKCSLTPCDTACLTGHAGNLLIVLPDLFHVFGVCGCHGIALRENCSSNDLETPVARVAVSAAIQALSLLLRLARGMSQYAPLFLIGPRIPEECCSQFAGVGQRCC